MKMWTNSDLPILFLYERFISANISETITDELVQRLYGPEVILAEIRHCDRPGIQLKVADVSTSEKLEKFVEDVKYVWTAFLTSSSWVSLSFRSFSWFLACIRSCSPITETCSWISFKNKKKITHNFTIYPRSSIYLFCSVHQYL